MILGEALESQHHELRRAAERRQVQVLGVTTCRRPLLQEAATHMEVRAVQVEAGDSRRQTDSDICLRRHRVLGRRLRVAMAVGAEPPARTEDLQMGDRRKVSHQEVTADHRRTVSKLRAVVVVGTRT